MSKTTKITLASLLVLAISAGAYFVGTNGSLLSGKIFKGPSQLSRTCPSESVELYTNLTDHQASQEFDNFDDFYDFVEDDIASNGGANSCGYRFYGFDQDFSSQSYTLICAGTDIKLRTEGKEKQIQCEKDLPSGVRVQMTLRDDEDNPAGFVLRDGFTFQLYENVDSLFVEQLWEDSYYFN